jgi:hypothetical protein
MNPKDQPINAKKIYNKPVCLNYSREEPAGVISPFDLRTGITRGLTHAQLSNPVLLVVNYLGDASRVEIDSYKAYWECRIIHPEDNEQVFRTTLSRYFDQNGMIAASLLDLRDADRAIELFLEFASKDCRDGSEVIVVLLRPDTDLSLWRQMALKIYWELHSPVNAADIAESLKAFLRIGARAFSMENGIQVELRNVNRQKRITNA